MSKRYLIIPILGILLFGGGYAWLSQQEKRVAPTEPEWSEVPTFTPRQGEVGQDKVTRSSTTPTKMAPPLPETAISDGDSGEAIDESDSLEPATMEERVEALETRIDQVASQIALLSSEQVQSALLEAIGSEDAVLLNVAKNELIIRGQKGDSTAAKAIRSAFEGVTPSIQAYLVGMLGEIATDDALQSLIEVLDTPYLGPKVKEAALESIAAVGKHREGSISPHALSAPLEDYFDKMPKTDPRLLAAVTQGIATVGTAEGIEKVLRFVEEQEAGGAIAPDLVDVISASLRQARSPEAIAPLNARLREDPGVERAVTRAAGEALAAMGNSQATDALLQWASESSGESQNQRAITWLSQVRDEQSLQLLLHAEERYRFRDQQLLKRITDLAKQIDRESTPELVR